MDYHIYVSYNGEKKDDIVCHVLESAAIIGLRVSSEPDVESTTVMMGDCVLGVFKDGKRVS